MPRRGVWHDYSMTPAYLLFSRTFWLYECSCEILLDGMLMLMLILLLFLSHLKKTSEYNPTIKTGEVLQKFPAASERLVLITCWAAKWHSVVVILCLQRDSPERETPKMRMCTRSCADDKGLVGREICEYAFVKQAVLKLVQTFAQQCFRSIPQNDQSPVTRTEFEGAGRRFSEEIDQKGRLKMTEPAACVCVCLCH